MSDEEAVYEDAVEEEQGWGDRLKQSFACACIGVVLFFGSFPLLYWNEGRAVARYDALNEGEAAVVSINAAYINTSTNGQLVYIAADLTTNGTTMTDPVFGVSTTGDLKFQREVEMYQWVERTSSQQVRNADGSTSRRTSYQYDATWSSNVINSNNFNQRDGHQNPNVMPYDPLTVEPDTTYAGAYILSQELNDRVDWYTPYTNVSITNIPDANLRRQATAYGNNGFYVSRAVQNIQDQSGLATSVSSSPSANPVIGDVRVTFSTVQPGRISVIAQQDGDTFTAYETTNGDRLLFFRRGNVTADEIFQQATDNNQILTWVLRFVGLFIMWLGIDSFLHPLEAFCDIIPCLGNMVSAAINLVALVFTFIFGGLTIAIAWLIHHPTIGLIVLAVFLILIGLVVFAIKYIEKKKPRKSAGYDYGGGDDEMPSS